VVKLTALEWFGRAEPSNAGRPTDHRSVQL
jgi:hypothetical protein